jgi:hypothetical protein
MEFFTLKDTPISKKSLSSPTNLHSKTKFFSIKKPDDGVKVNGLFLQSIIHSLFDLLLYSILKLITVDFDLFVKSIVFPSGKLKLTKLLLN